MLPKGMGMKIQYHLHAHHVSDVALRICKNASGKEQLIFCRKQQLRVHPKVTHPLDIRYTGSIILCLQGIQEFFLFFFEENMVLVING